MRNQLLKEYQKNGTIKSKVVILLLDFCDKPISTYKTLPNMLNEKGANKEIYNHNRDEIRNLIDEVKGDGYDILSLFHVEYCDKSERLYTFFKKGIDLTDSEIFVYDLIKDSTFVLPDGSIELGRPRLELLQTNW
jgi:hypothetical protein